MLKKICLYLGIIVFLGVSVLYELYSVDRELFHIHEITRGSLKISGNIQKNFANILKQINNDQAFKISTDIQQKTLSLRYFDLQISKYLILSTKQSNNFLTLLKSEGDIKSHGDSFYKITDRHQKICNQQIIKQILLQKNSLKITGEFSDCQNSQYRLVVWLKDMGKVDVMVQSLNKEYNRVLLYFEHKSQNNYYGLGQQFSHLNLGHNRPYSLFVREKGVGRTDQPQTFILNLLYGASGSYYNSYSPSPIWYSISTEKTQKNTTTPKNLAYFFRSWAYCIWMNNQIYAWDTIISISIYFSTSLKQVVKQINRQNGYTPSVPDWVNEGAIVGLQGGTEAVMKKYQVLKKAGAVVRGLWLQDWVSKRRSLGFSRLWWNWELDRNHYGNWDQMVGQLQKQNVSVLIYINPMLTNVQNKKQNYTTNFYKKASSLQCFVTKQNGKIFQTSAFSDWSAALFDFDVRENSNQFYKEMLRDAIKSTGARGLMVDFGEAYPVEGMGGSLEDAVKNHNMYPTTYHGIVREVLDQFKDREIYTFSRAGYLYAPKYTLSLWAGDQSMNFKKNTGLPSCLTAMLSSSLVGYSNTHCDIGGYSSYELPFQKTSVRTEILMTRWMQLGAFSPVFRTHEGNLPQKSLQVYSNQKIATEFAFYSQIFNALSKYRADQAQKSIVEYLPLIRPFFLENQLLAQSYKISDQYYLGEYLLVSPILTALSNRKYFVPVGKWQDIWTKQIIEGCDCYKQSKTFLPPVLIKFESEHRDQITSKIAAILQKFKSSILYLSQNVNGSKSSTSQL